MQEQFDYTGKFCMSHLPFSLYKEVDTIDCLVPYSVDPDEILFVIMCNYHEDLHDHNKAILEIKFLYNGAIYQNQFNWGNSWSLPFHEAK
jgi:hypothetical protein